MRKLLAFGLSTLSVCCLLHSANLFAGPPQPGPQAPQTKYLIRRISDTDDNGNIDDGFSKISGTSLVWRSGPRGDYESQQVKFYNPSLNHPLGGVGLGSKLYTQGSVGKGNYHLSSAGDRVTWMEDVSGQADIFSSDGISIQNLTQTTGLNEGHPRALRETLSTYFQQSEIIINDGGISQKINSSPGHYIWGRYVANDDYLVYLERPWITSEKGHQLKAYNFDTQLTTTVTNANNQWTINGDSEYYQRPNFAIDGTDVYWAATYTADGPYYDNHEIYSYDLAVGPSSYTQVTQNGVDDFFPQAAGGRAGWYQKHVAGDPNSNTSIILREGGVNAVIEPDAGILKGLSGSRVIWSNSNGNYTHVLRDGTVFDQNTHLGTVRKSVQNRGRLGPKLCAFPL